MAKKKKKKKSLKTLKNKVWKVFSLYIRLRDTDDSGYGKCVTCETVEHYTKLQAGHAVGGRTNAILFHEEIVHAQCVKCNVFMRGNYNKYALFMIDTYGREKFEHFLALKHAFKKFYEYELDDMYKYYKNRSEELKSAKLII